MIASTAHKRTPFEIARDRLVITELYCQGIPQHEIADRLGVSQPQISYDVKAIQADWAAKRDRLLDAHKAEQLAKIDVMEREYYAEYFRSKQPFSRTVKYAESAKDKDGPQATRAVVTTEERLGDPRYLAGVAWCIEQRCKILGLYAPEKIDITARIREAAEELGLDADAAVAEAQRLVTTRRKVTA
jgi:predicted transcriptional regulator